MNTFTRFLAIAALVVLGCTIWAPPATAIPPADNFTIRTLDAAGNLLPGGTFRGWNCTRWNGDSFWTCGSLNNFAWFNDGLTTSGTIGNSFNQEVPQIFGWSNDNDQCVVVEQVTAPAGYAPERVPAMVCKGPGGWTSANASGITLTADGRTFTQGMGAWTVTNDAQTLRSVLSLANTPAMTLTINNVDGATGALLPGGQFEGFACIVPNNEPDWTCNSLNVPDYPWFADGLTKRGTTGTSYTDQMDHESQWTSPVNECLIVREVSPPSGYVAKPGYMMVCKGEGGWTPANAAGISITPVRGGPTYTGTAGEWTITNVTATRTTTLSLSSKQKETSSTTTAPAPTSAVVPAQSARGIGANTGATDAAGADVLIPASVLGAIVLGLVGARKARKHQ